jgi:hypothetical protein
MSEQDLDRSIDEAVRDIMNVDTDAAFRARVLAQLERRPRFVSWRRATIAAAATAAVVLAIVLTRPSTEAPSLPTNISSSDVASTPPAQRGQVATAPRTGEQPQPLVVEAVRPAETRSRAASSRRLVATVAETTPGVEIEPLTKIEAIQVAPAEQSSITPSPIVVAPLTPIAAVEIEPLSPQIERD